MKTEEEIAIDDQVITRYLSGEGSPEEAVKLIDWLQAPGNRLQFEALASSWSDSHPGKNPTFNKQIAWSKMEACLTTASSERRVSKHIFEGLTKHSLRIAASLLIILAGSVLVFLKFDAGKKQSTFSTTGESLLITLADQSKVTLYHHTRLDYPLEFEKDRREVFLVKGEAFFEVTADQHKPFIVHTAVADITVVGTKFNVVANEGHTEISVEEGRVMASTSRDSILLTKGLTGVVRSGGGQIISCATEDSNSWGYATHKFVFKDASVKSVISAIEKAYPCTIQVANSDTGKCKLTATFDHDPVEKIVDLIAEILNLTVKRNDRVFILEGEGCP